MVTQVKFDKEEIGGLVRKWQTCPQNARCIVSEVYIDLNLLNAHPEREKIIEVEKSIYLDAMQFEATKHGRQISQIESIKLGLVSDEDCLFDTTILIGHLA